MIFFLLWLLAGQLSGQSTLKTGTVTPFEQLSAQAAAARDSNDVERAIALYRQGVTRRPKWAEGWYFIATMEYDRDRYKEARDAFRNFLPLDPGKGAGWALLGLCEFQTKGYELALQHIARGLRLGAGSSEELNKVARYHEALLLTHFGRFEEAAQQLMWFARSGSEERQIVLLTGLASLRRPIFPEDVAPQDSELVTAAGRAVLDLMARRAAQAAEEMRHLASAYPDTPNVHYIYGTYLMEADPEAGLRELKRELEISPGHVPALTTIAIQLLKDDAAGALPYARKAVEFGPGVFVTHNVYGRALMELGQLKAGIAELEVAAKLAPDSVQTRITLASAYAKDGRKEDAARERAAFLKLKKAEGKGAASSGQIE